MFVNYCSIIPGYLDIISLLVSCLSKFSSCTAREPSQAICMKKHVYSIIARGKKRKKACTCLRGICPCACYKVHGHGEGKNPAQNITFLMGLSPKTYNKWQEQVEKCCYLIGYIMKMKGKKKMHTPRQKVIHNPIPTYVFC